MTRAFWRYPICQGSIGLKWFGYNLGSGHATISVTWIAICFTIHSNEYKHCLQTTIFSVFVAFFISLSTKQYWHHNRHNNGRRRWKLPPSTPHEALHSMPMLQIDGWQPLELAYVILGGVEGVYSPQSAPLFWWWCIYWEKHAKRPQL
jgi:hypothetical protein